jgi:hypothetical protein
MNERIEQLSTQAVNYARENFGTDFVLFYKLWQEKFAELIVQECAQIAVFKDSGIVATADVAGYMAAGRSIAARLIQEHFGVKE